MYGYNIHNNTIQYNTIYLDVHIRKLNLKQMRSKQTNSHTKHIPFMVHRVLCVCLYLLRVRSQLPIYTSRRLFIYYNFSSNSGGRPMAMSKTCVFSYTLREHILHAIHHIYLCCFFYHGKAHNHGLSVYPHAHVHTQIHAHTRMGAHTHTLCIARIGEEPHLSQQKTTNTM